MIPGPQGPELAVTLDRTIKGRITAKSDGNPMPGVNVILKGSQTGTSSDAHGNYSINVDDSGKAILVFSYIGYETQEIAVGNQSVIVRYPDAERPGH